VNVLLAGAAGFFGRHIAAALAAAGHRVTPVSRRCGIDFRRLLAPAPWAPHLDGIDAVINSVGIIGESGSQRFETLHTLAPVALFRACAQAGVRRVVQISALGADATAFSAFHRSKRAADEVLRDLDLDWFVLRPSLVYGRGGGSASLFMRLAGLPRIPVIGNGQQKLQPIHISDVVTTVLRSLTTPETRRTLDLVGPEIVTFAEWLQRMRVAQGRPRAPLFPVPYALAMALAHVAGPFVPILQPENLRMLQAGCHADVGPLIRFLGRAPQRAVSGLFFSALAATGSVS
jgi:uncharacterized protein YbjT (DUF2867 family)